MKKFTSNIKAGLNPKKLVMIGALVIATVTLLGYLFMSLWNWLMPTVFGLNEITLLQGYGLIVLSKILLGGVEAKKTVDSSSNNKVTVEPIDNTVIDENSDADELYEKWWNEEGETYFENYLTENMSNNE